MRFRKRNCENTPQDPAVIKKEQAADAALREARSALTDVQVTKRDGWLIAETLAAIRAENHFKDMWNEGLRGE